MKNVLSESYFVSAGEADPEGELSFTILTGRLIEIATAHANSIGIGNPDMKELGGGWVLGRLTIQMDAYPAVNTRYVVDTWIENWNRLFSSRCFRICSPDGIVYGYARSVWMIINLSTHENLGLAHFSLPDNMIPGLVCPIPTQAKHKPAAARKVAAHTFTYSDLDYYRHVNTLRWIDLILDRYSLKDFDMNFIHRFEISFQHEGKYGMSVDLLHQTESENGETSDEWIISHEDKPLVNSRIILHPRPIPYSRT